MTIVGGGTATGRSSRKRSTYSSTGGTKRLLDGIFEIDRRLRGGGCASLDALAEAIEASPRTVQRYFEVLRDRLGAEVVYDRERGGYRYRDDTLAVPQSRLSEGELLALYVAAPILAQYRGTPLGEEFEDAFDKLAAALPGRVRSRISLVLGRIGVKAAVPTGEDVERFRSLLHATLHDRQLEITYFAAYRGAIGVRRVDPYALHNVGGDWYLLAYCHQRKQIVPFHVGRVWSVGETGKSFERPNDFDAESYLKDALGVFMADPTKNGGSGEIVVWFDALAARYVRERQWHPSQQIEDIDGGGIELRLKLDPSVEVERFVLAWGEHAEVLAPKELRARMMVRLRKAGDRYRANETGERPSAGVDARAGRDGKKRRVWKEKGRGQRHTVTSGER